MNLLLAVGALTALASLLLLGVPVFVALGVTAAILLLVEGVSIAGIAQVIVDHMNSATLTALPFFIIAAAFLQRGGIAAALIDMALAWLGRLRGGLAYVAVMAGMAFSSLSGSSVATAMAIGTTLAPEMAHRGYPRPFSLALIGVTGTLGILVPPSIALIIFGLLTGESIPRLFLAGVIPGCVQALMLLLAIFIQSKAASLPAGESMPFRQRVQKSAHAMPALFIVAALFGGIYSGALTATEAAALTATLAVLASVFVYKGCKPAEILPILAQGVANAARIVMIIASAILLSHWIVTMHVAESLINTLLSSKLAPWQFLLIVNLLLLMLGIILEGVSTMLIVLPLVAPLLKPMGIDPLQFAIIMVINIEIGMLHPPLGMNVFVLANIGKCGSEEVIRGLWPFLGLMLLLLALVTFVPALSTFLPGIVYG